MDKEFIRGKFISIESWAYRARHQMEIGNPEKVLIATGVIRNDLDEIEKIMKSAGGNREP